MMPLKEGDKIPHFTAKDASGQLFESHTVIGKKSSYYLFLSKG